MKIKTQKQLVILCAGITLLANWHVYAQSNNTKAYTTSFLSLTGGGNRFSPDRLVTNSFPYTRIAGDTQDDEMQYYLTQISEHRILPEIMPVEQDTNGDWGVVTDGLQLSLRFRQSEFLQGDMVPAYMILRNLGSTARKWLRNALPDNGYQFTLRQGTKVVIWMRPQQKYIPPSYVIGGREEGDPYWYVAEPKTEGLTIVYLNRFFDLSQFGRYSLQVQIRVPTSDGKGATNVVSGTATFEVVPKLSH